MKKIVMLTFALLALAACKDDDKPQPSEFTNTYTYDGVTTAINWGGFYYDAENDLYAISVCKDNPEGAIIEEDEFISFKVPGALMNTTVDVTDIYDDEPPLYPMYFIVFFGHDGYLYNRQEGTAEPEGIESGEFKITRVGNTKNFTVTFSLAINDNNGPYKILSGNYRGTFEEGESYGDIGVIRPLRK